MVLYIYYEFEFNFICKQINVIYNFNVWLKFQINLNY